MSTAVGPGHVLRRYAVPVQPKPFRLVVGTRPTRHWLLPGPDGEQQVATKVRLLRERTADVLLVQPGAEPAVLALARLVMAATGATTTPAGSAQAALAQAALAVPEDLCLMQRDASGSWRLTAGCVCFPSHWRLADKVGDDLSGIHDPVPGYAERLAAATRQAFDRIADSDDVWERFNWILTADSELFHPDALPPQPVTAAQVPHLLWLRTERQTLRALPDNLGVVFGIRTFLTPLSDLTEQERAALATSLTGVSSELARYRSALGYREAVQEWVRSRELV